MTAPTWYDLLDVPRDASAEEIRAAWKGHIADLEPGDRRFDSLNRAARVLLDPRGAGGVRRGARRDPDRSRRRAPAPVTQPADKPGLVTRLRRPSTRKAAGVVPAWLLAGLGVVAAALVAVTAWMWLREDAGSDEAARAAQTAAERAVVPVLSYDFENLEADRQAATAEMTGRYRSEYDKLFALIEDNAPQTETRVGAEVVASGIVRASGRARAGAGLRGPADDQQAERRTDGLQGPGDALDAARRTTTWLVDDMVTSPVQG